MGSYTAQFKNAAVRCENCPERVIQFELALLKKKKTNFGHLATNPNHLPISS